MTKQLLLAVPLYRNAQLVPPLVRSLERCVDELLYLKANILFVVDSPDDQELLGALAAETASLAKICSLEIHINEENIGFIRSMNFALRRANSSQQDIIILNSDVEVFPGVFKEMKAVAHIDHMIGFVSPRSNNATICSLPYGDSFRHRSAEDSYQDFCRIKPHIPRIEYVPTAVGFALYIKWQVLADFGVFDEVYGFGYNEENDLIMRANRCGYRAAIANHAFTYHVGEQSFDLTDSKRAGREKFNAQILNQRYEEYQKSIDRYFSSDAFRSYQLLDALIPEEDGKISIGFDMTSFGAHHNGTYEAGRNIILFFASRLSAKYNIFVICSEKVFSFHKIDMIEGVKRLDKEQPRRLAAIIRVGQPFNVDELVWARLRAPMFLIFMLDTIAIDCFHIDDDNLSYIWQKTIDAADCLLFNSNYTQHQYSLRFSIPDDTRAIPLLHSTNRKEYCLQRNCEVEGDYVLLIGNGFEHKDVRKTLNCALKRHPSRKMVVMGVDGVDDEYVRYIKSGQLDSSEIADLFAQSALILFPSHYEGFGFPIMNALACSKPVIARKMPIFEEIKSSNEFGDNIHLYDTREAMVDAAFSGELFWLPQKSSFVQNIGWEHTAKNLDSIIAIMQRELDQAILKRKLSVVSNLQASTEADDLAKKLLNGLTLAYDSKWRGARHAIMKAKSPELRLRLEADLIRNSIFFDEEYYAKVNPDVASAGIDFAVHFARDGWHEGRDPGPYFGTKWYIDAYPDIGPAKINPLTHYLLFGVFEGREIFAVAWQCPVKVKVVQVSKPLFPLIGTIVESITRLIRHRSASAGLFIRRSYS